MDKLTALLHLTRRLNEAARGQDWEALAQADRALSAALPDLVQGGNWNAAECTAFEGLRHAHQLATERCTDELARLDEWLAKMRANREGWLAYAQGDELKENQP
ncbi:MAG: hypothetical protein H6R10_2070 [Rhodocyclaceae bacterium]|nr:hypothetical protein [Rhodocyclaceae bacterium]